MLYLRAGSSSHCRQDGDFGWLDGCGDDGGDVGESVC
jgi:hypothetical protein